MHVLRRTVDDLLAFRHAMRESRTLIDNISIDLTGDELVHANFLSLVLETLEQDADNTAGEIQTWFAPAVGSDDDGGES